MLGVTVTAGNTVWGGGYVRCMAKAISSMMWIQMYIIQGASSSNASDGLLTMRFRLFIRSIANSV